MFGSLFNKMYFIKCVIQSCTINNRFLIEYYRKENDVFMESKHRFKKIKMKICNFLYNKTVASNFAKKVSILAD